MLGARLSTAADHLEAEFYGAKVPTTRRLTRRRVVLYAKRVPGRDLFGAPTDADALDATIRGLIDRRVVFWRGAPPAVEARPKVYRLRHKTTVPVWVVAL